MTPMEPTVLSEDVDPGVGVVRVLRRIRVITLAGVVAVGILSSPVLAAEPSPGGAFMDDDGSVHEGGIEAIAAEGITTGCNPPHGDRFCPDRQLTRAEMATMLVRAMSLPSTSTDHFTDDQGHVLEGAINRLAETGITQGCNPPDNDHFCPNRSLTRAEAAAFIARARGLPASPTDHFVDDDGHILEGAINRLAESGITQGCNPPAYDRFCPDRNLTRAEMATLLTRTLGLTSMKPPPRQVLFTPDIGVDIGINERTGALDPGSVYERYRLWDRALGCDFGDDLRACTIDITSDNAQVIVKTPDGTETEVASWLFYYPIRVIPSSPEGVYEFTFELNSGMTYRGMINFLASREVDLVNTGLARTGANGKRLTAFNLKGVDFTKAISVLHHRPTGAVDGGVPGETDTVDEHLWIPLGELEPGEHTIFAKVDGRWYYTRATFPQDF